MSGRNLHIPFSAVLHGFAMRRYGLDADEVEASIHSCGDVRTVCQPKGTIAAIQVTVEFEKPKEKP